MMFDIELKNVFLKYKDFEALKDISLQLEAGKIYGLLGRNGAGKTSLLSLLSSLQVATEGTIKVGGETAFENANIMQHVAFLYESDLSDEHDKSKSMLDIVERYRPYFDAEYAMHLADRFKLPLDKPVNKLSKGMQSTLGATMGLACRAPITIFDEVYLGMDAPTREIFYQELLEDQNNHPRTIILSTHLVSEMDYLFDEVIIIDKGELVLHEEYEKLVSKGASITGSSGEVDEFVSSMPQLREQQLGDTKSVMVYGRLNEEYRLNARQKGLELRPISLQDLFIYLTSEEV
ncbi:ABC transporter ATP-binding protein [Virgibacillus sp. NKC19-16]|uniref:ATP-binding cassette domain-containing protein n=1 Tax=Virgibacillus salidurans TaxID=2831673 RepID=UPI001F2F47AB|nr:ABC transporter ATP-binding protein [Virgibacillus sp. NKC19-16]UJL46754.1 ABC transporter ATP-binding protein [Virgibacillus sp. NKC19-16]